MSRLPSPCIDVCKFRRRGPMSTATDPAPHCIGCSMTKGQKRLFKTQKGAKSRAVLVRMIVAQQEAMGKYAHWMPAYLKRLRKKGVKPPFDPDP
ncbi:hypothetical protein JAN5088_02766 [Jannaschia rubra]|uniref:Fe-S protein n=2 Tax=Jannaschia rubra TaxID=282197 RepID=A0A0M6XTM4_9RHOB|nr:DUF1289 domain-containing protein [Jannaschia rubra]CTQ33977.1 hypothetical protein JAN5088_02766 [Jannaschia rubra]SFG26027.1 hypothetical protein SAMN04488517_103372 [Jannaschia rubra]